MNYINLYTNFLKGFINIKRPLKVVFDCSNGTAGLIIKEIINYESGIREQERISVIHNSKFIILNSKPDGNFPAHGPDPMKKGVFRDLQSVVKKHKADLGVIFDADGDRVFFIDDRGRFVDQDVIAKLLIWRLKPKKAVIDVRTGWLVKKPTTNDLRLITSKVGHYFIKKLMREINADFGAERSGHYYFKKFFYAESGVLAAIETINAISRLPYKLADFNDLLPQYYRSGEINIRRRASPKQGKFATERAGIKNRELLKKLEKKLRSKIQNLKPKISRLDGLTIETKDYWFNLRPSNTEPLIRLNVEAKTKEILRRKTRELLDILKH